MPWLNRGCRCIRVPRAPIFTVPQPDAWVLLIIEPELPGYGRVALGKRNRFHALVLQRVSDHGTWQRAY